MENAVVYCRYSSYSQTEQSIEGQLAAAYKYAQEHDYKIIHEYCDRAKTGTNDNREQFQKMLKDSAKHKFTVIIVWKVDRFGRNREEISINKHKVKKHGVRVEYVAENISQGPEGVILESVLEGMAEYYSLQLSQNIKRGLYESAKKRQVIGGRPPYGYRVNPEDKTYQIVPEEADVVRLVYDKYLEGMPEMELIDWLNINGYRNRKHEEFKKNSVHRMLTDERYYGMYKYQDIADPNGIPPIVTEQQFLAVQQASRNHAKMSHDNWCYSEYHLSDKCYCAECGSKMKGASAYNRHKQKYLYYLCPKCKLRRRSDVIDSYVSSKLHELLGDTGTIDEIASACYDYYVKHDDSQKDIERIEAQIESIKKREGNILRSIEDGLPYAVCKPRLDELASEKADMEVLLNDLYIAQPLKLNEDMIKFFLRYGRDSQSEADLLNTYVKRVEVHKDHIEVWFNFTSTDPWKCSTDTPQSAFYVIRSNTVVICGNTLRFKMFF